MDNKRNIYLENSDLEEALSGYMKHFNSKLNIKKIENINVVESMGRITAKPLYAIYSSPNFNASAMDGIALKSVITNNAREGNPVTLVKDVDYIEVDTGDPIIGDYDAVIMIEDLNILNDSEVQIINPVATWQNIRPVGEDIVAGELILSANHKIRPVDVAALINGGIQRLEVFKKITVGIIPTGTEIVELGSNMKIGDIIESNSRMFEGLTIEYGAVPKRYEVVEDNYEKLKLAIQKSVEENDITIINAGSSAGREDFTKSLIGELGEVYFHGLAIKPGKPAILGQINNKPVIGIPGYPVSGFMVFRSIAREIIMEFMGTIIEKPVSIQAILSKRIVSSYKYQEYVRMKLGKVGGKIIATPLNRGAGVLMSLVKCDGILMIPKEIEGFEAGEKVEIELMKSVDSINNTLVSIGSHDLVMDIINNHMKVIDSKSELSSVHIGSMGGIMALRKRECHLAPIHLLNPEDGVYNIQYLKKYLPDFGISLIKGFGRIQGLIVQKGNPKNIKTLSDLKRKDITFVNRQKGSGTRVLLDYNINMAKINKSEINGYDREMTTHMAVAAAVKSETADVGLGVYSAAHTMDLEFIPLFEEDYDFAVYNEDFESTQMKLFINIIKSESLKEELIKLGGYTFKNTGKVVKL